MFGLFVHEVSVSVVCLLFPNKLLLLLTEWCHNLCFVNASFLMVCLTFFVEENNKNQAEGMSVNFKFNITYGILLR